jgi:hypothetical protein
MNLPKHLVQKLGKEQVSSLIMNGVPLSEHTIKINTPPDFKRIRNIPAGQSQLMSKKKWRDIKAGRCSPDILYGVDEALERAGL